MGNSASYVPPEKESKIYPLFEADQAAQTGKVFAITGCTTGTGIAAAKLLAKKGAARVFLLNRPSPRAEAALAACKAVAAEGCIVTHVDCDLADFNAVRKAAAQVAAETKNSGLDVLCNNAGVMALKDVATGDGYDIQMQTNHLSHFLLTKELYPVLVKAVELRGEARVVNHSSFARNGPPGTKLTAENCKLYLGKNGGDLGGDGSSMILGGARWVRYAYTKLSNAVFTLALSEKLEGTGIKALCATPGLAATNLQVTTASDGAFGVMDNWIMRMAQSGEDGAVPLLYCCVAPGVENGDLIEPEHNGKLMPRMCGSAKKWEWGSEAATTADKGAFWAVSEAAAGKWDF